MRFALRLLLRRRPPDLPYVRPWGLAVPVLVLLVALPLLRPLRHPEATEVSDDEIARLATVAAIVENHGLAVENTSFVPVRQSVTVENRQTRETHVYSDQPPMLAALLSAPYWILQKFGYSLRDNSVLVPYLLTLMGVTLPVAGAAGLAYRMGRLFELQRHWRAMLALAVVFGGGLISYATVLNAHAPAAALVMAGAGCLVHLARSRNPSRGGGWLALAGGAAALAGTVDRPAFVFFVIFIAVILAMRWPLTIKTGGVLLYLLGATPPLALHAALNVPITGDWKPAYLHPELTSHRPWLTARTLAARNHPGTTSTTTRPAAGAQSMPLVTSADSSNVANDIDDDAPISGSRRFFDAVGRTLVALFGSHGLLSHFPVVIFGLVGMGAVMHRHWPGTTKALAAGTAIAAVAVVAAFVNGSLDDAGLMFANRYFLVFLPMTVFWAGAWLRRKHLPVAWSTAGVLLAFSIIVSLLGATDPLPRTGYDRYTAASAFRHLIHPQPATESEPMSIAAGM
jgi:hypothetical protein